MCPPGTDQTTRGPQHWNVMVPLLEELHELSNGSYHREFNPQQLLLNDYDWDAFNKLAKRSDVDSGLRSAKPELSLVEQPQADSRIERLPAELLSTIIADPALEAIDINAFGLASRTLWLHVLSHVRRTLLKGSWAGTPLLCTGSYLMSVPPAIHSIDPDIQRRENEFFSRLGPGPRGCPARGTCPARTWNWNAVANYTDRNKHDPKEALLTSFHSIIENSGIPKRDHVTLRNALRQVLNPIDFARQPPKTTWILRNHDNQEYVVLKCSRTSRNQELYWHVKGSPSLSLDKALIMRISWSLLSQPCLGDTTIQNGLVRKFVHGPWAGHCFDVVCVTEKDLNRDWQDVTTDISKEWKAWKSAFVSPS